MDDMPVEVEAEAASASEENFETSTSSPAAVTLEDGHWSWGAVRQGLT